MHRKDLKGQLIQLRHTLHEKQLTNENRVEINKKIQILKQEIKGHDSNSTNNALLEERRQIVHENEDLKDIFSLFWKSIRGFIDVRTQLLTEDGYIKLNVAMQYALSVHIDEKDAVKNANEDWLFDCKIYNNKINEVSFTDILYDLIETSTDVMDHIYYSAFAWTLQNEILDLNKKPPKVKTKREIQCIIKPNCEAAMIMKYLQRKIEIVREIEERKKLMNKHIAEEELDVEQELRLGARKEGLQCFNDNQMNMLEALAHAHEAKVIAKARRKKERAEGSRTDDDSSLYSDSDSEMDKGSRSSSPDSDMERSKRSNRQGDDDEWASGSNRMSSHDSFAATNVSGRKAVSKPHVNRQSRSYFLFQSVGEGADSGYYVPTSSFVKKYKPFVYEPHQGKRRKEKVVYEGPSYLWPTSTQRKKTKHYKQFNVKLSIKNNDHAEQEERVAIDLTRTSLLSPLTEYSKPLTPLAIPMPKVPEPSFKSYNVHTLEGYWDKTINNKRTNKLQKLLRGSSLHPKNSSKKYRFHSRELATLTLLDEKSEWKGYLNTEARLDTLSDVISVNGYSNLLDQLNTSDDVSVLTTTTAFGLPVLNSFDRSTLSSTNESVNLINNNDDVAGKMHSTMSSSICLPKKTNPSPVYNVNYERSLRYSRYLLDGLIKVNILKTRSAITSVSNSSDEDNGCQTNESQEGNRQSTSSTVKKSISLSKYPMGDNAGTPKDVDVTTPSDYELFYHNIRTKYLLDELTDKDIRELYSDYQEVVAVSQGDSVTALSPVVSKSMNSYVYVDGSDVEQVQAILAEVNSTIDTESKASKTKSSSIPIINEDLYLLSHTEPLFFRSQSYLKGKSASSLLSPISLPRHGSKQEADILGSITATQFPYKLKERSAANGKKKQLTTAEKQTMVAISGSIKEYEKDRNDIMQLCVSRASIMEAIRFVHQQQALKQNRTMAESGGRVAEESVQPFDKEVVDSYMEMSLNTNNKVYNMCTVSLNKGGKPGKKYKGSNPDKGAQGSLVTQPQSMDDKFNDIRSESTCNIKDSKRLEPLSTKEYDRALAVADTLLYQQ